MTNLFFLLATSPQPDSFPADTPPNRHMKRSPLRHAVLLAPLAFAFNFAGASAQTIGLEDAQSLPIEINADGETRFEDGIAIADNNVSIEFGTTSIFCDKARFNPKTKELYLDGNVRIYQDGQLYLGERAIYNIETKHIDATALKGSKLPMLFEAGSFKTESEEMLRGRNVRVTTHDSAKPDFHWQAKSVRLYPDDRVIFSNVTWKVGNVPVLWFPYLYQSLDDAYAFSFSPGYSDTFGAYLLTRYAFPIGDKIAATARVDLMADRGVGFGLDGDYKYGPNNRNWGSFRAYFIEDSDPTITFSGKSRSENLDSSRYRLSLQHRAFFTGDIYASVNINKLSDEYVLQDFFEPEFRLDPQPDNVVAVTKWDENYTLTATVRAQVNDFFATTSRLPEIALDIKRQPLFDSGLFYESETSVAMLERNFAEGDDSLKIDDKTVQLLKDYDATRFDTFHQFTYPLNAMGWLSVVPRAGFRVTYYDATGGLVRTPGRLTLDPVTQKEKLSPDILKLRTGGSDTRTVLNLGLEASFKVSKTWDDVQSRALGLDGLRHVVQPYTNFSYVSDPSVDPEKILQFDRLIPSTQLNPLDFPQFTALDSIDQWTVLRLGVRQRLQTRRGDSTLNWLELDTYADVNIENPYYDQDISNLFNNLTFRPLPWASLNIDSQLPVFDDGFTEVNTYVNFMPADNFDFSVGHRFLDGNPLFEDSSLLTLGLTWKINDHWAFSAYEQYELDDSTLQSQSYMLHRDLQSWIASLGAVVRDNSGGDSEFALLLTFTLKELPELSLPIGMGNTGSSR